MRRARELFTLSNVLGMRKQLVVAAVGGRLYHLIQEPRPGDGPDFAVLFGAHRRVEGGEKLSDVFSQKLKAHTDQVMAFQSRFLRLRLWPHLGLAEEMQRRIGFYRRLRFVTQRLIPKLRQHAGPQTPLVDHSREVGNFRVPEPFLEGLARLNVLPEDLVEEILGGDVLILGQNVFPLNWMPWGQCPRSGYIQVRGESYAVQTGQPNSRLALLKTQVRQRRTLMALEKTFQTRLSQTLKGHQMMDRSHLEKVSEMEEDLCRLFALAKRSEVLYRDPERSVIWRQDGSIFCCQEVPPFVMEAADRQFRLFDRVRVGVRIDFLDPREVLGTDGAHVMEAYDHAFVFNYSDLGDLCMGHDHKFFQRFWEMPLEDGTVEFLNAARLVLQAGCYHTPGSTPYVPSGIEKHPLIDLHEAVARNLPVYRYYRAEAA